jgi:hypothetical protein
LFLTSLAPRRQRSGCLRYSHTGSRLGHQHILVTSRLECSLVSTKTTWNRWPAAAAAVLAHSAPSNNTLTTLNLKYNLFPDFPPSWIKLMMTRNYSLEQVEHSCKKTCWWMTYACRLNQGGRRLLRRRRRQEDDYDNDVPMGLWPMVLEHSSNNNNNNNNVDAMFYLVRHGPMLRER